MARTQRPTTRRPAAARLLAAALALIVLTGGYMLAQTGGGITYVYDDAGRLVAVINPAGETAIYSYDATGNLLSISRRSSAATSVIYFSPHTGPEGATVTIYGTGFGATAGENTVTFNGTPATVVSATTARLVTTVPAGATTGPISVTSPAGAASSGTPFTVVAADGGAAGPPTISGFAPNITTPGAQVVVAGTNFEEYPTDNRVRINDTPVAVSAATNSAVTTRAPSTSGRILVETPYGAASSAGDLFVAPPPYTAADVSIAERIQLLTAVSQSGARAAFGDPHKVGMFLFDGVAGNRISLHFVGTTMPFVTRIYKPDGKELTSYAVNYYGPNVLDGFIDVTVLPASGTYTILVDPQGASVGETTLKLYDVPPDITVMAALGHPYLSAGIGTPVNITIPGQRATLSFFGEAGRKVFIRVDDNTIPAGDAELKNGSNAVMQKVSLPTPVPPPPPGSTHTTVTYAAVALELPEGEALASTGVHTIVIDPARENIGTTKVTLYDLGMSPVLPISIGGPPVTVHSEYHEPAPPPPPGVAVAKPPTNGPGTNWWLVFGGAAGQKVSLQMTDVTIAGSYVSLNKPDGTFLVNRTPVNAGTGFIDTVTLPAAGTYKIFVDPVYSNTGDMTLKLHDAADVVGSITPGGNPVPVAFNVPGQRGVISFTGVAAQKLSLQVSGVSVAGNTAVSVRREDDTSLAAATVTTAGGIINDVTIPADGNYKIVVDPAGPNTGALTLTLADANDVLASITPGGPPVTVTTTTSGQNARVTFQGTAGQKVSLKLSGVTIPSSNVSIKNPDGTTLVSPVPVGTAGQFVDAKVLPVTGTYTIIVDPASNYTGSMTLTLYDAADVAAAIAPGGPPVAVTTTVPGQNARLTFSATAGQRVSLKTTNVSMGSNSINMTITRPDGPNVFGPAGTYPYGDFVDATTLPVGGTYTILVDPYAANVGSMTLTLYDVVDVAGTIAADGSPVTVTTTTPGQNARLTFEGTAGQMVSMRRTNETLGGPVTVLKPDGTTLSMPALMSGSVIFHDAATLPTTGTYTLVIDPSGQSTGSKTIALHTFAHASGSISPNGSPVTVTTASPGQNASLTFGGTAGQAVSLRAAGGSTYNRPYDISVLKPDGTTLLSPVQMYPDGSFIDTFTLPTTGAYTLLLNPSFDSTGSATLTMYDVTDIAGSITPGGPPVNVNVTTPGQNARYTFEGTAGQEISLTLTNQTVSAQVSVTKPDGTTLPLGAVMSGGVTFYDATPLPATGTYTVRVNPYTHNTGGLTLTLYNVVHATGTLAADGSPVAVSTTVPGQNARLTFAGAAGQKVSLNFSGGTTPREFNVSVIKPDGANLFSPTGRGPGSGFVDTFALPVAGTYTLLLNPSFTDTGGVTVNLYDVVDATGTLTVGGPSAAVSISTPGQNARLTFDGTAGQQVTVRVTGNTISCPLVTLRKPDGAQLTAASACSAGFNLSTQTLPVTGVYTVEINPGGSNTGGANVAVTNP